MSEPNERVTGEYLKVRRAGVPLIRPSKSPEILTLEDFGRAALQMMADAVPPDVRDHELANTRADLQASKHRMKISAAGLGGLSSLLFLVVVVQNIYYRGYASGAAMTRVEVETADATDGVEGPEADAKKPGVPPAPPDPDPLVAEMRSLVYVLSVLQQEQQAYLAAVLAAQAARKKLPSKPQSLLNAEVAITKLQGAPVP